MGFFSTHGYLFYHNRLVLASNSPSIPLLMKEFHYTPMGGHSRFLRTYRRLTANLYWVGMSKMTRDFVRSCLNFITSLPKPKGYQAVLVVVAKNFLLH
jgi:hypothetical protein